jgi:hypothetical protein
VTARAALAAATLTSPTSATARPARDLAGTNGIRRGTWKIATTSATPDAGLAVKRVLVLCLAALAVAAASAPRASADLGGRCGLPATKPLWIDFADGSVPFWRTFARPGVIAAASNFIFPPRLRALGAKTVYWDMYLNSRRVGTPDKPADPADVVARAQKLFDYAAASSACATPVMVENELFGASLPTPWAPSNAQYRANVLLYLRTLASRGAHPVLLVSSTPYTFGEAADWWRAVAQVADIVREVYFPAPQIREQGATGGSRAMRVLFRRAVDAFVPMGIPTSKLGIMLGFQTTPGRGFGGRENLQPASAWFEVVKLQALAAKEVAKEFKLASVWSWGWGVWSDPERDPDKPTAACVYLWARNPKFCDGPSAAGPDFNSSVTEGQLVFAPGVTCTVNRSPIRTRDITALARYTGDTDAAFSALYARAVESERATVTSADIVGAERSIIDLRFRGSAAAYASALAKAHATRTIARGIIGDELRRAQLAAAIRVAAPTSPEIGDYYAMYAEQLARPVEARPAPDWLGRKVRGFALASFAPERVFALATGSTGTLHSLAGDTVVRALGAARPLSLVPLDQARPSIVAAVTRIKRADAYGRWIIAREKGELSKTSCRRDNLPVVAQLDLSESAPFLALP